MADIVATVLWNYAHEAFEAFLEYKKNHTFSFIRKESDGKRRNFEIKKDSVGALTTVEVGEYT